MTAEQAALRAMTAAARAPRRGTASRTAGVNRSSSARLFAGVPLFMIEESPERLMRHKPPYGYRFGRMSMDDLLRRRKNATLPKR
eukprot:4845314-Prymnesium_polylepis.1